MTPAAIPEPTKEPYDLDSLEARYSTYLPYALASVSAGFLQFMFAKRHELEQQVKQQRQENEKLKASYLETSTMNIKYLRQRDRLIEAGKRICVEFNQSTLDEMHSAVSACETGGGK